MSAPLPPPLPSPPRTPTHEELLELAIEHGRGRLKQRDFNAQFMNKIKAGWRAIERLTQKLKQVVINRRDASTQEPAHRTPTTVEFKDAMADVPDVRNRKGGRPKKLDDVTTDLLLKFQDEGTRATGQPHGKDAFLQDSRRLIAEKKGVPVCEVPVPSDMFYWRARQGASKRGLDCRDVKVKSMSVARVRSKMYSLLLAFHLKLLELFKHDYDAGYITKEEPPAEVKYNVDEVGVTPEGSFQPALTIVERDGDGRRIPPSLYKVTAGERNDFWVTLALFTRADGTLPVPPVVVFEAAKLTEAHVKDLPPDWTALCSSSGYLTRELFPQVAEHFLRWAPKVHRNSNYLFMDGHGSHFASEALTRLTSAVGEEQAATEKIDDCFYGYTATRGDEHAAQRPRTRIIFLRSHSSAEHQPNDNGPNAVWKKCYREAVAEWKEKYPTLDIDIYRVGEILAAAWKKFKVRAPEAISRGWEKTYLEPFVKPPPPSDDVNRLLSVLDPSPEAEAKTDRDAREEALHMARADALGHQVVRIWKDHVEKSKKKTRKQVADETTLTDKLLQACQEGAYRAMIRFSAREAVHANIVVRAAEVQRKLKEEERAKKMKVPDADERAKLTLNPDTTTGLVPTSQASVAEMIESCATKEGILRQRAVDARATAVTKAAATAEEIVRLRAIAGHHLGSVRESDESDARAHVVKLNQANLRDLAKFFKLCGCDVRRIANAKKDELVDVVLRCLRDHNELVPPPSDDEPPTDEPADDEIEPADDEVAHDEIEPADDELMEDEIEPPDDERADDDIHATPPASPAVGSAEASPPPSGGPKKRRRVLDWFGW